MEATHSSQVLWRGIRGASLDLSWLLRHRVPQGAKQLDTLIDA